MTTAVSNGLHATPWADARSGGEHVARAAKFMVWTQAEAGHGCPISMTLCMRCRLLRHAPDSWRPATELLLTVPAYDPAQPPPATKAGLPGGDGR